jgi:hypothetical protein
MTVVTSDQPHEAMLLAQARQWAARRSADPYDRAAREQLAQVLFEMHGERFAPGSAERCQMLLNIMADAFPIPPVHRAYIEALRQCLAGRPRLPAPGRLVLGLGTGRCGSTSLTALLTTVDGSCATHENPPLIYWQKLPEQIALHVERFALLREFFPLVFDASHWWGNAVDDILARFPDVRIVGLHRETERCIQSFLKIKGSGRGSINHWAPSGNGIWRTNIWDPLYPSYPSPQRAADQPDAAKQEAIRRYVVDYNAALAALRERLPDQVLLIRTEDLAQPAAQQRLFDFIGVSGTISARLLNAGTVAEGQHAYWF